MGMKGIWTAVELFDCHIIQELQCSLKEGIIMYREVNGNEFTQDRSHYLQWNFFFGQLILFI